MKNLPRVFWIFAVGLCIAAIARAVAPSGYMPSQWREPDSFVTLGDSTDAPPASIMLPAAPAWLIVSGHVPGDENTVVIKWGDVSTANWYTLQRMTWKNQRWEETRTLDISGTQTTDTPGAGSHCYRVRSVRAMNEGTP